MTENRQYPILVDFRIPSPLVSRAEDHPSGVHLPPHRHPTAQLIHAASGVMTVETEDGLWVVPPERAVWVPAFVTHSIRMTGFVEMRTLYLEPDLLPEIRFGTPSERLSVVGGRCFVVNVSKLLHEGILRALLFEHPYAERGPEARLVSVLLDEIRAATSAPLHLPMPRDHRALRVAEAFRAEPGDRRRISQWALMAGASERTLERLFRKEVGMTFGKWQQQARLLRGLETLAAGETVTEAALQVGFDTSSAFIAMFRRAMGETPARYFRSRRSNAVD